MKTPLYLKSVFAVCLFVLAAVHAHADENDEAELDTRYEDWFQIELIIFDRPSSQAAAQEAWRNNIAIEYPSKLDFLLTQNEWEALSQSSPVNKKKRSSGLNYTFASDVNEQALPEMEVPRIKLPKEEFLLSAERDRLNRRPGFKVLFHEAWRQELKGNGASRDIVINGGKVVDGNHQLEGTVKLTLRRFLHLETNLWRNTFAPNTGQELPYWPPLPKTPKPTPSDLFADDEKAVDTVAENEPETVSETTTETTPKTIPKDMLSNTQLAESSDSRAAKLGDALSSNKPNGIYPSSRSLNLSTNGDSRDTMILDRAFNTQKANLVTEIVTLKQRRRMRSSELHYIDHPRLGLIIKITPYEVALPEKTDLLMEVPNSILEN